MNVLVLSGGDSSEREVSLRSGAAVIEALKQNGYDVSTYDPKNGIEGLKAAVSSAEVVLPVLHGDNGEDGVVQEQLEQLHASYLGATSAVSRVCISKVETHRVLEQAGVLMPSYEVVDRTSYFESELRQKPFVLKTVDGGSSVDILIVRQVNQDADDKAALLLSKRGTMILEQLIDGQEITVGILDRMPLPIIAITPPSDAEFDYENKYNGKTQELCPVPESMISKQKQTEAQDIALKVHRALGVRHLSRTDMILAKDGTLYVLELNTIPGLTDQSLYPKAARAAGLSMPELTNRFVEMVRYSVQ